MALSIKNEALDRKIRRLATLKRVSLTRAVEAAVDHELEREEKAAGRISREDMVARLREIQDYVARDGIDWSLSEDEILGYDANGIPEQPGA